VEFGTPIAIREADADGASLGELKAAGRHSEVRQSPSGALMQLLRRLLVPASESHLTVALALCVMVMSLLLCGMIWQSGVIDYQRELIHLLWQSRYGG